MTRMILFLTMMLAVTGCDRLPLIGARGEAAETGAPLSALGNADGQVRPVARPEPGALDAAPAPAGALGTTIVSLGTPAEPGLWLKTPLVTREQAGRVVAGSATVAVTLRPIDGPATAGSRLSLPAMQALGLPLTDLTEVAVFAG